MYRLFLVLAALALAGCSFAPEYRRPEMVLPVAWQQSSPDALEVQWWRRFEDPALNALVQEALLYNKDIEIALARLEIARAGAGVAYSDLAPHPSITGASSERWTSTRIAGAPPKGMEQTRHRELYFGALWELDFWGKYRNAAQGAMEQFLAVEANRDAAYLSVAAFTAKTYFDLLQYQYQIRIAEKTVTQRQKALNFYAANVSAGTVNESDLLRARGEVEVAKYTLSLARLRLDEAHTRLQVLLGRSPAEIMDSAVTQVREIRLEDAARAAFLPSGLPLYLLERRPDLKAAEQALRAAQFDIGVVRADYFPSISLSGQVGIAASKNSYLTTSGSGTWLYGVNLRLPLDFWQTRFREKMAEEHSRELVVVYELSVQTAFKDLRDSLSRQKHLADATQALSRRITALRKATSLAADRYSSGYSNYLELLDAERALFDSQISWSQNKASQLQAMVDVCLALGGGWSDHDLPERMTASNPETSVAPSLAKPVRRKGGRP